MGYGSVLTSQHGRDDLSAPAMLVSFNLLPFRPTQSVRGCQKMRIIDIRKHIRCGLERAFLYRTNWIWQHARACCRYCHKPYILGRPSSLDPSFGQTNSERSSTLYNVPMVDDERNKNDIECSRIIITLASDRQNMCREYP